MKMKACKYASDCDQPYCAHSTEHELGGDCKESGCGFRGLSDATCDITCEPAESKPHVNYTYSVTIQCADCETTQTFVLAQSEDELKRVPEVIPLAHKSDWLFIDGCPICPDCAPKY